MSRRYVRFEAMDSFVLWGVGPLVWQDLNESFVYYFENGVHLDGAIDLTQGMQNLVIYAPGDLDRTLDDYQGYELV